MQDCVLSWRRFSFSVGFGAVEFVTFRDFFMVCRCAKSFACEYSSYYFSAMKIGNTSKSFLKGKINTNQETKEKLSEFDMIVRSRCCVLSFNYGGGLFLIKKVVLYKKLLTVIVLMFRVVVRLQSKFRSTWPFWRKSCVSFWRVGCSVKR